MFRECFEIGVVFCFLFVIFSAFIYFAEGKNKKFVVSCCLLVIFVFATTCLGIFATDVTRDEKFVGSKELFIVSGLNYEPSSSNRSARIVLLTEDRIPGEIEAVDIQDFDSVTLLHGQDIDKVVVDEYEVRTIEKWWIFTSDRVTTTYKYTILTK